MPHWALSDFDPFKVGLHSFRKSPFAFMARKVTDMSLVVSCMSLLIIPWKIFKWDKPGSLRFVNYLEELKERERQTGKRWPFFYGIGPERMKWSEVAQSCPALCDPKYCSLQAPSSMGLSRILEWVAIFLQREWRECIIQQARGSTSLPALTNGTAPGICLLPSHLSAFWVFKAFFHDLRFHHCSLRSKLKSRNCPNFYIISIKQCFLFQKSLFPSEAGLFFPFESFSCEVLYARSEPIVALKAFDWLACLSDPLLLCASFQQQISVRQLEMGLEMCKLCCRLNKLVILW